MKVRLDKDGDWNPRFVTFLQIALVSILLVLLGVQLGLWYGVNVPDKLTQYQGSMLNISLIYAGLLVVTVVYRIGVRVGARREAVKK